MIGSGSEGPFYQKFRFWFRCFDFSKNNRKNYYFSPKFHLIFCQHFDFFQKYRSFRKFRFFKNEASIVCQTYFSDIVWLTFRFLSKISTFLHGVLDTLLWYPIFKVCVVRSIFSPYSGTMDHYPKMVLDSRAVYVPFLSI